MKLALFGATGPSGKHLIEKALAAGHGLIVFARNPSRVEAYKDKVKIVAGELTDKASIARALEGADSVISLVGANTLKHLPGTPVAHGVQNLLDVMKTAGVRRIVQIGTPSLKDPKDSWSLQTEFGIFIVKLLSPNGYDDMLATGKVIRGSDLDWTLVRVPNLTDKPASGKIKEGYPGKDPLGMMLARGNLAPFLLKVVQDPAYIRQAPAISDA